MQVALVAKEKVEQVLPYVLPVLNRAVPYAHGRYTLDDLRRQMLAQEELLWVVFDPGRTDLEVEGVLLTAIGEYPSLRVLRISFLAGRNLDAWILEAQRVLLRFAQEQQCQRLEMMGRTGWLPILKKLGWELASITLEKDVREEVSEFRQREHAANGKADYRVPAPGVSTAAV